MAGSVNAVIRERSGTPSVPWLPPARSSALAAWRRLQDEFDTSCIGLIAEPGSGTAVCQILDECLVAGTGPGAIVLLGFCLDLVLACTALADASGPTGPGTTLDGRAAATLFEWPAMMIFLPEHDRLIGECAAACRAMRSRNIPISLDIMRSLTGADGGANGELVAEIDCFLAKHLTPCFPKLPP